MTFYPKMKLLFNVIHIHKIQYFKIFSDKNTKLSLLIFSVLLSFFDFQWIFPIEK